MASFLDGLVPDAEDVAVLRAGKPLLKGPSRLEVKTADDKLTLVNERALKKDVWKRDKGICRWCLRKVVKTIEHIAERGEVHHLHGRLGDLLFEAKCAVLVCLSCHEKLTGKVNEKWFAVGTKFWKLHGVKVIDARAPLKWERAA